MTVFLARFFIKNYMNVTDPAVRQSYGILNGVVGIFFNVFLFAFKLAAGLVSNSIAIMADALNNLSDAGSSLISIVGFRLAGKEAESEHPFGHGRLEYVTGLIVALLILLMAYQLLVSSVEKILHPEAVLFNGTIGLILVVSILVKVYMYYNNKEAGEAINSKVMEATATDSISDAASTSVVLLASLVAHYTGWNIDGYCGVVVALLIAKAGWDAARDTISPLLGNPPSPELVAEVEATVMAHEEILGVHDLVVHDYGPGRFMMSLHAEVSSKSDILEIHDLIDRVEKELGTKFRCEAVIHMDPIVVNDPLTKELYGRVETLLEEVDPCLCFHDFRVVKGRTHTNIIFDMAVPFGYPKTDAELVRLVGEKIRERNPKLIPVIKVDKVPEDEVRMKVREREKERELRKRKLEEAAKKASEE